MSSRPDYIEEEITKVEEGSYAAEIAEEPTFLSAANIALAQKVDYKHIYFSKNYFFYE